MTTIENLDKEITIEELLDLQQMHDKMVRKIFDHYISERDCSILTFAGFLCDDVLPEDLFQEIVKAKLEARLNRKEKIERVNEEPPIKTERQELDKNTRAKYLNDNIESCKTLVSMPAMIEGNRKKSYGLKPKKNYNNLKK